MNNETLENKLKKLSWWIFCLSSLYLICGAFLISDYPLYQSHFDPSKTYGLLNDTFTLIAYFVTPAIAWALFTDWRDQHRRINNEKISKEIIELLRKIQPFLNVPANSLLNVDDFYKFRTDYFSYLIDLKGKNNLINPKCSDSTAFISDINKIADLMHNFWLNLETQVIIYKELEFIKDLGSDFDEMRKHYSDSITKARKTNTSTFVEFMDTYKRVKILYV